MGLGKFWKSLWYESGGIWAFASARWLSLWDAKWLAGRSSRATCGRVLDLKSPAEDVLLKKVLVKGPWHLCISCLVKPGLALCPHVRRSPKIPKRLSIFHPKQSGGAVRVVRRILFLGRWSLTSLCVAVDHFRA